MILSRHQTLNNSANFEKILSYTDIFIILNIKNYKKGKINFVFKIRFWLRPSDPKTIQNLFKI